MITEACFFFANSTNSPSNASTSTLSNPEVTFSIISLRSSFVKRGALLVLTATVTMTLLNKADALSMISR